MAVASEQLYEGKPFLKIHIILVWICTDCELGLLAHLTSRDTCNHYGSDKRHFAMKESLPHSETNHAVLTSMQAFIHTQFAWAWRRGISSSFICPFQSWRPKQHTSSGNGRSQRDYGVVGSLFILGARVDRQSCSPDLENSPAQSSRNQAPSFLQLSNMEWHNQALKHWPISSFDSGSLIYQVKVASEITTV